MPDVPLEESQKLIQRIAELDKKIQWESGPGSRQRDRKRIQRLREERASLEAQLDRLGQETDSG